MHITHRILGSVVLCCSLAASLAAAADKPAAAPSAEEQAMMQKWQVYMTPSEGHKLLANRAGNWTMKVSAWMAPGTPPAVSDATSEIKAIMDGRYLEDTTHGNMMGMPFEGHGLMGYDNMKKKYVSTWIDNMGTGIMVMEGSFDAATKTWSYLGTGPDVESGTYKPMKSTEKMVSPDQYTMEMFNQTPDGKGWWKNLQIEYTRAK